MKECNLCGRLTKNNNICDGCYRDLTQERKTLGIAPTNYLINKFEERIQQAIGNQ